MAIDTIPQRAVTTDSPTLTQVVAMTKRTNDALLKVIRDNFHTQYGTQTVALAEFRDAVSAHGGIEIDAVLLAAFRTHVPLSDYDSYTPFINKFKAEPCRKDDVENLLAPGFPNFIALTGGTTGTLSKMVPRYDQDPKTMFLDSPHLNPSEGKPIAAVRYCGIKGIKEIIDSSGQVLQKIPICLASAGRSRRTLGWMVGDDESWISSKASYYVVPWAATLIDHVPSFLTIHGLFFLACRDVDTFSLTWGPWFLDLIYYINDRWDELLSCIRDGDIPDLEGLGDLREHMQVHFRADPDRSAELAEIGPPFSLEGWAARVWPKARFINMACNGPFSTVLPKVRSILGPTIPVLTRRFGGSEGAVGYPHDARKLEEFILAPDDVFEFLDVSQEETHENIFQAWEVEVGKHYEVIHTNRNGLWRYQLGDIVSIVGFHVEKISPVFKFVGRRSLVIRLPHAKITDSQLVEAITAVSSEDGIPVQEFTTMLDDRMLPPTVGFFIELAGPLGSNARQARQRLFDALAAINIEYQHASECSQVRLPTIRILKPGTCAEFRRKKCEYLDIGSGQSKMPVVIVNRVGHEWVLEGVVEEL